MSSYFLFFIWYGSCKQHSVDVGGGVWYVCCNAERFGYRERVVSSSSGGET